MPAAGLYIHIPFCRQKCPYCDFYSIVDLTVMPDFLPMLRRELTLRADPDLAVDAIYFGGGTPSLLPTEAVDDLLALARSSFAVQDDVEVTLEANPGAVDADGLVHLKSAGVNRLNIGVQSFRDEGLRLLGRIHNKDDALAAIAQARAAGFDNLGLDLIFGLPGQTASQWRSDLAQALRYRPEHLSCYMLTFEPDTVMTCDLRKGRLEAPAEADVADLFETTAAFLENAGYDHYEISNYARRPDFRSRHNLKYWRFDPYLGFGPAAHSYREGHRSWNVKDLTVYTACLQSDQLPEEGREDLSREQQILEALLLGLRLKDGFAIDTFEKRFGLSVQGTFGRVLNQLVDEGCLAHRPGRLALTARGMRFHDSIAGRLADAL